MNTKEYTETIERINNFWNDMFIIVNNGMFEENSEKEEKNA